MLNKYIFFKLIQSYNLFVKKSEGTNYDFMIKQEIRIEIIWIDFGVGM